MPQLFETTVISALSTKARRRIPLALLGLAIAVYLGLSAFQISQPGP